VRLMAVDILKHTDRHPTTALTHTSVRRQKPITAMALCCCHQPRPATSNYLLLTTLYPLPAYRCDGASRSIARRKVFFFFLSCICVFLVFGFFGLAALLDTACSPPAFWMYGLLDGVGVDVTLSVEDG
jgi:hypothetical protein